jgi:hypothetical protein
MKYLDEEKKLRQKYFGVVPFRQRDVNPNHNYGGGGEIGAITRNGSDMKKISYI